MKLRSSIAAAFLVLLTLPIAVVGQDVIRTATPSVRGLTEADFPRVKEIVPNVYVYEALTGPPDDRYTTNSMFVVTEEGVLVADGQGNLEETARLVTAIAEITTSPITHVVICSDHGDHTNGNRSFPDGVEFIAQKNSLPALERAAKEGGVMPDTIVNDRLDLKLGERDIQILFLGRAHTGGDLFVWLPDEKVLFTTEVFLNHMFSGYRSAFAREWLVAMDAAEELKPDIYIPGHGFVDSPEILEEEWFEYKNHLQVVLDEVTRLHNSGLSVDEAIDQADFGPYNDWSGADSQGPIGIRRIYAELNGEIE